MQFVAILALMIIPFLFLMGMLSPQRVLRSKEPTRLKVFKVYGSAFLGAFVIALISPPMDPVPQAANTQPVAQDAAKPKDFKHAKMTLKEYLEESKPDRKEIAEAYVKYKGFDKSAIAPFHACMSYMARKKSETLTTGEVLSWCLQDYENNRGSLAEKYIDYDAFEDQFSPWDGSHNQLERYVKKHMNDPDSYEHIETRYRVVQTKTERHAEIFTSFRGKNAFGGVVKNSIMAKTNLDTGEVMEIIEQE